MKEEGKVGKKEKGRVRKYKEGRDKLMSWKGGAWCGVGGRQ